MGAADDYLRSHRSHDYRALIARWRRLARRARLTVREWTRHDDYPVFVVTNRQAIDGPALYLSAGIHGDEPAPPTALLEWAEADADAGRLAARNVLLLPCMNPWGLENNRRSDSKGRDLNRSFDNRRLAYVRDWQRLVKDRRFDLALSLHEDYDSRGVYIYELNHGPGGIAEKLLAACHHIIPHEPGSRIDGSRARNGVVRRRVTPETWHLDGLPEAVYLHFHQSRRTLTLETPSEFSLHARVRAYRLMIAKAIRLAERAEP